MDRLGFAEIELDPLRETPAAGAPTGGSIGVDGEFCKVVLIFLLRGGGDLGTQRKILPFEAFSSGLEILRREFTASP